MSKETGRWMDSLDAARHLFYGSGSMGSNKSFVGRELPSRVFSLTREISEAYARATADTNPAYFGENALAPPLSVVCASIPLGLVPSYAIRS